MKKSVKTSEIPPAPGVYFFKDSHGKILYIGKAANLRSRVRSHFRDGHKEMRLYEQVAKIDWQETGSEIEALVLEAQLIKKHQPPYNILFRDDKNYFFVGITKEEYPKVFITHQPLAIPNTKYEIRDTNTEYLGPFTSGEPLKQTLRLLRRIFTYCTCKEKHKRPCLPWHLGRCLGICCLRLDRLPIYEKQLLEVEPPTINAGGLKSTKLAATKKREYRRNIKNLKEILQGHTSRLLQRLRKEMAKASKSQHFEEAAKLRDQVEAFESTLAHARIISSSNKELLYYLNDRERSIVSARSPLAALQQLMALTQKPRRLEAYDISNIQGKFATGSMVVFEDGQPKKSDYRMFRIRTVQGANDVAMLKEVITRRFRHLEWPWPNIIIVDGGKGQVNAVKKSLPRGLKIPVLGFAKGKERKGTDLHLPLNRAIAFTELTDPLRNLLTHIDNEAHRFAIKYYRKLHRKEIQS